MQMWLLVLLLGNAGASTETTPAQFVRAHLGKAFTEQTAQSQVSAKMFRAAFSDKDGVELIVRATAMPEPTAAQQMLTIEGNNIRNLYRQRRNPYEGQITDLVKCDRALGPLNTTLKVRGVETNMTCGGVNARKGFGACSRGEMKRWGCYLAFYAVDAQTIVDVRLYSPGASREDLATLRKKAGALFQP